MFQQTISHSSQVVVTDMQASAAAPAPCAQQCWFLAQWTLGKVDSAKKPGPSVKYGTRKTIYSRGDRARYSYKVLTGTVRLSRILMDGHRQILDLLLPGDTFGLESTDEYTATAETIGEVELLRCPRACLANQLATRREAPGQIASMLSAEVSSAQDHIAMLTHQGALERVALFLLRFAERQNGQRVIELPAGRQDMADYLGLTIETTCRSLTELRNRGVISIKGRRMIEVRNREVLEGYAEGDERAAA